MRPLLPSSRSSFVAALVAVSFGAVAQGCGDSTGPSGATSASVGSSGSTTSSQGGATSSQSASGTTTSMVTTGAQGGGGAGGLGGAGGSGGSGGAGGGCNQNLGADLVHVGDADKILLQGTIITPTQVIVGEVLVVGTTITCVAPSCAAQPGAATASVVNTHGIILPGLIDAHNHVLYDVFDEDDWSPPANNTYTDHNSWTSDAGYGNIVDAKQYLNGQVFSGGMQSPIDLGCELDKYGELKAIAAGTTSMLGHHGIDKSCFSSLAHTLSTSAATEGFPVADKLQVSALTLPSNTVANSVCTNYGTGTTLGFVVHLGEGKVGSTSETELMKFGLLPITPTGTNMPGCLMVPQTTLVHADAFNAAELTQIGQIGMSIIASPHVQVVLYGHGTDYTVATNIPLARSKGINVGLGPDWSLGGSVNLLEEMRYVHKVDAAIWGNVLSSQDIVEMATINNAIAMHIDAITGTLQVGKLADIAVIKGDVGNPYDAVLAATPDDVMLTLVSGVPIYGDTNLSPLGPASPGCETIDVCCGPKFACVAKSGGTATNKLGQTFAEIRQALEDGLAGAPAPYPTFLPLAPIVKCQ